MDLAIVILAADPQDLARLQPAHQVGLAVLLHQRRWLLGRHGDTRASAPPVGQLRGEAVGSTSHETSPGTEHQKFVKSTDISLLCQQTAPHCPGAG